MRITESKKKGMDDERNFEDHNEFVFEVVKRMRT